MQKQLVGVLCFALLTSSLGYPINHEKIKKPGIKLNNPHLFSKPYLTELHGAIESANATERTTAIINEYVDKLLAELSNAIVVNGLDPMQLPDIHEGFEWTIIITIHGELDLTIGWLQDLSTILRKGDVVVNYDGKIITITAPLGFRDLMFNYEYSAKFMDLGPEGGVDGSVQELQYTSVISINFETYRFNLDSFTIGNSGTIDVNFTGNPLLDWLADIIASVTTGIFRRLILSIMEDYVKGALVVLIDVINSGIDSILNPTTAVTPQNYPQTFSLE